MTELKETTRVEAFSDAVFAIAITLLILEIKVPETGEVHSASDLWRALYHLWPSYFAFIFSFGAILVAWVNHHHVFNTLGKISRPFMYANGFLLLTITFIPFPTAVLAEYITTENALPAIVFYCFSSILNTLAWYLLGRSVVKPRLLLKESLGMKSYHKSMRTVKMGLAGSITTTVLALWLPYIALAVNFFFLVVWLVMSLNEKDSEI